jgi:hypothetical protein
MDACDSNCSGLLHDMVRAHCFDDLNDGDLFSKWNHDHARVAMITSLTFATVLIQRFMELFLNGILFKSARGQLEDLHATADYEASFDLNTNHVTTIKRA